MKIIEKAKAKFGVQKKKVIAVAIMLMVMLAAAIPASAAPNTGDTDVDAALTAMETAFATIKSAFWYLALAAIPITLAVLAFFWLRGKFKQAVSGS